MRDRESWRAYLFLSPLVLLVGALIVIPTLGTLSSSFFQDVTYLPKKFTGFDNYANLLRSEGFPSSLRFTVLFAITTVVLEALLGLAFALLLNELFPGRSFLRTLVLIPWAVPTIVSARLWQLIYNYNYGLLNYVLVSLGFSPEKVNWLGTPASAFCALVIADVWKTTPFMTIILLAGLQAIPENLYKQARVDGSRLMKRFLAITVPLLKPALVVALIFRTADSMRIFDLVYVMTGGGPAGSTRTLSIYGFQYFINGDFGIGSAVSVITFMIVFGLSILYIRLWRLEGLK